MIFSSFIVDATVTLLKRLLRHESVWEAHREHYYQRLIQMGASHQKVALMEYVLMVVSGVIAMIAMHQSILYMGFLLVFCLLIKLSLMRLVDLRWLRYG